MSRRLDSSQDELVPILVTFWSAVSIVFDKHSFVKHWMVQVKPSPFSLDPLP